MTVLVNGVRAPIRSLPFDYWPEGAGRRTLSGTSIPRTTPYSIRRGDSGAAPFAVQKALESLDHEVVVDGDYGPGTEEAVGRFQQNNDLTVDGVFGPASSALVARKLEKRVDGLPGNLLRGFVTAEGGNLIAAVNWSVPGGVDCGYLQRRVYESQYGDDAAISRAFDGLYQMKLLKTILLGRYDAFLPRPGVGGKRELAWRLACLHHNYPYAADKISQVGLSGLADSYWRTPQTWVTNVGAHFDDGEAVRTPVEWCRAYSLGAPGHDHPGWVTRFVKTWPQ